MKRRILFIALILLPLAVLTAEDSPWAWDAQKGDDQYTAGDYDAAWLFYERALSRGLDDGLVLYRAAESFSKQTMVENPEFEESLFAVAHYYLSEQYPDNPALAASAGMFNPNTIVNRRFLRQTYSIVGAKAPKERRRMVEQGFGSIGAFFTSALGDLGGFWSILRNEGIREAFAWAKAHVWRLAVALLMVNALTGIILPVVMAVTVAREGRKSYVTAYLFLIHWGPLGIHRFYLGRHISAIIWLFTGGLLGLGVFFDVFLTGAYVRFWNEDHRDGRPGLSPSSTRNTRSRSRPVKPPKVKKPKRAKKVKPPKAPKAPKSKKEKKGKKTNNLDDNFDVAALGGASSAAALGSASDEDGFSFAEPSGSDDFDLPSGDDFPDLSDSESTGTDDFSLPDVSGDSDGGFSMESPEGMEDLSDDDFDLGSLE